jgi:hypothetical protein
MFHISDPGSENNFAVGSCDEHHVTSQDCGSRKINFRHFGHQPLFTVLDFNYYFELTAGNPQQIKFHQAPIATYRQPANCNYFYISPCEGTKVDSLGEKETKKRLSGCLEEK